MFSKTAIWLFASIGFFAAIAIGAAFIISPHHFVGLAAQSWEAMIMASGTTTFGFVVWTFALSFVCWLAGVLGTGLDLKKHGIPSPLLTALRGSRFVVAAILFLVLAIYSWFFTLTVNRDHQSLLAANKALASGNAALTADVEWRKNNFSREDPVIGHVYRLLTIFQAYRGLMKGEPCVIYITAPQDSFDIAQEVETFSNSVSGCYTFGPIPVGQSPDADEMVKDGMVPEYIVIHAPRDDKAAYELWTNLSNLIQSRLSYMPPKVSKDRLYGSAHNHAERFLWLQFGTNTKWNSERYGKRQITGPG
jgi:hypothetical protein